MADRPAELPVDSGSMPASQFPAVVGGVDERSDVRTKLLDFLRREGFDREDCERCFVLTRRGGLHIDALPQIHERALQNVGAALPADLLVIDAEWRGHGVER